MIRDVEKDVFISKICHQDTPVLELLAEPVGVRHNPHQRKPMFGITSPTWMYTNPWD